MQHSRTTAKLRNVSSPAQRRGVSGWEPLAPQDAMFVVLERANARMHVGTTLVVEPESARRGRHLNIDSVRRHLNARLDALPRYRKRLEFTPLRSRPVWVDDSRFCIEHHVRHLALPRPGTEEQLRELSAQVMSQPLDRGRPLWEVYVVDGLSHSRYAIIAKVHHCMVDGIGGVQLIEAMLDVVPSSRQVSASTWCPAPQPTTMELLAHDLRGPLDSAAQIMAEVSRLRTDTATVARMYSQAASLGALMQAGLQPAPPVAFNQPLSPDRRIGWLDVDLAAAREVKQRLGGKLNDVILATVAGALRRFLGSRRGVSSPPDVRTMVPVDLRGSESSAATGNYVGGLFVSLPVSEADPIGRYIAIRTRAAEAKASRQACGSELLTSSSSLLGGVGIRLIEALQPFNLIVSNVPGPPVPLFLRTARVGAMYPYVPLFANQGLAIALFSYAGKLSWGFHADAAILPDLSALVSDTALAFDELCAAAAVAGLAAPPAARPSAASSSRKGNGDGAARKGPLRKEVAARAAAADGSAAAGVATDGMESETPGASGSDGGVRPTAGGGAPA